MRDNPTAQEGAMVNQKLTQYRTWRLWPVHAVARLFGVLVKVDGFPFGSSRLYQSRADVGAEGATADAKNS